jgi:hypothetical protein
MGLAISGWQTAKLSGDASGSKEAGACGPGHLKFNRIEPEEFRNKSASLQDGQIKNTFGIEHTHH